jgi:hypothetical protein
VSDDKDVDEGDWSGELAGDAVEELLAEESMGSDGSGVTSVGASLLRGADNDAIFKERERAESSIAKALNYTVSSREERQVRSGRAGEFEKDDKRLGLRRKDLKPFLVIWVAV